MNVAYVNTCGSKKSVSDYINDRQNRQRKLSKKEA